MKMGVAPQPSDPGRMTRLIGPARTKMILLAGQKIDAQTALQWGLVDRITEADMLMDNARLLTDDVIGAKPAHVQMIKNAI
jgi:enoyl-CoA hydratase/carnithine racemase